MSIPPIQFTLHTVPLLWLLTLKLQYDDYIILELWYSAQCFVIYGLALLETVFCPPYISAPQALIS